VFRDRFVGGACKSQARGFEIRITIPGVRFQMGAFGPFIPSVRKDQAFIWVPEAFAGVIYCVEQPLMITPRRTVNENSTRILSPGRIVPRRTNRSKQSIVGTDVLTAVFNEGSPI